MRSNQELNLNVRNASWNFVLMGVGIACLIVAAATLALSGGKDDGPFVVVNKLRVMPTELKYGDSAIMSNGICNDSETVNEVTYSLELIVVPLSLQSPNLPLSDGDLTFEPSQCEAEQINANVPSSIPPGKYKLYLRIDHEPSGQTIKQTSNEFQIIGEP